MDSRSIIVRHPDMSRRHLLASIAVLPVVAAFGAGQSQAALPRWNTPGATGWPSPGAWRDLARGLDGTLAPVVMPDLSTPAAQDLLKNPFYLADEPALTQSSGWVDAWQSAPSAHVLKAGTATDIAKGIAFARRHKVRLVVKGGGHSYLGGSNAPDSLLIWTRGMTGIEMHDGFVPAGSSAVPVPAVSVGAGCTWGHVYAAVTTKGGRYVQGGGCTTVGVAGLVQGGGFGSFSKAYGLAAASLIEAEIVTADGIVRTVNAERDPELFWALKGGGGGTFGVVSRLTLRTHELPDQFGAAFMTVQATSDAAFRTLLDRFLEQYRASLFNPHWGEQVRATHDNKLVVEMVFQGIDKDAARSAWQSFVAFVEADVGSFTVIKPLQILTLPARHFWDGDYLDKGLPGIIARDDRPGASRTNWWWRGDGEQAAAAWHGYTSLWLPADLLDGPDRRRLADAWFAASRHWSVAFHFNKGLAGATSSAIAASRETAMNPQVLGAFALAIIAGNGPSTYPGVAKPDIAEARDDAGAIARSMERLRQIAPGGGSYLSECDYHLTGWRQAAWGVHADRLDVIKSKYDPDGLFVVHHGIGSDRAA